MKKYVHFILIPLPFLLSGCALVKAVILLPIQLVVGICAVVAAVLVGSDSMNPLDELYAGGICIDQYQVAYEVNSDLTYEGTLQVTQTVTSTAGLKDAQQASLSFSPHTQELELLSAEVRNPDGSCHKVGADQVFTRPSAAARNTPGYVSRLTTSVLFPQLKVGSQTFVKWRFKEKARSVVGFNYAWRTSFAIPVKEARIRIAYEDGVPLRHASRGPFRISEGVEGKYKVVDVILRDYERQIPERAMVAPRDVCPLFVATTVQTWEEIGANFYEAVKNSIEDTPEIRAQADTITRGLDELEAAQAIHRWVCRNIQYIAVYLGQMDVWIPHPASQVLENGYGDCKDQFVLMASLLKAKGIRVEPVLINLDQSFEPYPICTPLQFDHCMAYLPDFDLYSNPTDPYRDLGELDVPLSGKFVVIASPRGRTSRTPDGDPGKNFYHVHHDVVVGEDGRISGKSTMDLAGRPSGRLRRWLAQTDSPEQKMDHILLVSPDSFVDDLKTTEPSDLDIPLHCVGEWTGDLALDMAPTLYFPVPVGIDLVNPARVREYLSSGERRYPVVISAIEIAWSYQIQLPDGYSFTRVPKDRFAENDTAFFESRYRSTSTGQLEISRILRIKNDRFPPEQYAALRSVLTLLTAEARAIVVAAKEE